MPQIARRARLALVLLLPSLLAACGGSGSPLVPQQRPVEGGWVSSGFGLREAHPLLGRIEGRNHDGYDFAVAEGTPIKATMAGEVTFAGQRGGYGNTVILAHAGGLTTLYGHARELRASPGDRVEAGAVIGFVGTSGLSTGPHLHYELRKHGAPIDPGDFLPTEVRPRPAPGAPNQVAVPAPPRVAAATARDHRPAPGIVHAVARDGVVPVSRPAKTGE